MNNNYLINSVAITGVTGTLGCALIQECLKNNIKVIAFINPGSTNEKRIPTHSLITKVYCSLSDMSNFDVHGLHADAMIHLAWGSTNRAVRNLLEPQVENIKYSLDSVELAKHLGCQVYIGAGSQAEYGNCKEMLTEETFPRPTTAYGMAKLCSGQMTRLKCKELGIRHVWPRILSTYGPFTQDTTIINYTISSLLKSERPSLTRCEQIWDFLYVGDAARALLLLADKGHDGEVYCISSGSAKTLKEYLTTVEEVMNMPQSIGFGDLPYSNNTVMYLAGDISKIQRDVGFVPEVSFVEGIQKTVAWAKEYYSY